MEYGVAHPMETVVILVLEVLEGMVALVEAVEEATLIERTLEVDLHL